MPNIAVIHGAKELLCSKTFIVDENGPTTITIDEDNETLAIEWQFIKGDGEHKLEMTAATPTLLSIKCINWESVLPITLTQITDIGDFRKRKLSMIFSVSKIGAIGDIRQISISLYLGATVHG